MKRIILFLIFSILYINTYAQKKEYYDNGKLKAIGEYENGNRNGEWKTYYENGQLKTIGKYTNISLGDYTNDCVDAINGAASYFKKKMAGVTDKGFSRLEYDFDGKRDSSRYFYSGQSVKTAKLAVAEYGEYPVLINQNYDSNRQLNGIDILIFQNYKDLVFIIEPIVKQACSGSYRVKLSGEDLFSNEVLYTRDKESAYDLSVKMRTVFIYKLEWKNVKIGEWKHYDENGNLVKTENYLKGIQQK